MRMSLRLTVLAALLLLFGGISARAQDRAVDLELVIAVDVSGSMDSEEKLLQRSGYIDAFRHPEVVGAITSGEHRSVAVTYVEWAGPSSQRVIIPWRVIDGPDAAADFADRLAVAPSVRMRGTSISGALLFSAPMFDGNGFAAPRQVIDISGDGPNNMGVPVLPVRDSVVQEGIVINGLPITLKALGFSGLQPGELDVYYEDCVIGGPGAFIVSVADPAQLGEAIRRKLVLEVAGPSPRPIPAAFTAQAPRIDCLIGEKTRPSWLDENAK
jgi:hypothetical protein